MKIKFSLQNFPIRKCDPLTVYMHTIFDLRSVWFDICLIWGHYDLYGPNYTFCICDFE